MELGLVVRSSGVPFGWGGGAADTVASCTGEVERARARARARGLRGGIAAAERAEGSMV